MHLMERIRQIRKGEQMRIVKIKTGDSMDIFHKLCDKYYK